MGVYLRMACLKYLLKNDNFIFISYLIGSIPFGKIITKILTIKISLKLAQNIGATNVYRSVSKKAGLLVLILDGIKPIIV